MIRGPIDELAAKYLQTPLGQTRPLIEFITSYTEKGVPEALAMLDRHQANDETRRVATQFMNEAYEAYIERYSTDLNRRIQRLATPQQEVLSEFFTTYAHDKNWEEAYRKALSLIERKPLLSANQPFLNEFKRIARRVKPKKKLGLHKYHLQPNEATFFTLQLGPAKSYMQYLTKRQLRRLITKSFNHALQPVTDKLSDATDLHVRVDIDRGRCNFDHEARTITSQKQNPLSAQLCYHASIESRDSFERAVNDLKHLSHQIQKSNPELVRDLDPRRVQERVKQLRAIKTFKAPYDSLEVLDKVREFIRSVEQAKGVHYRLKLNAHDINMTQIQASLKELAKDFQAKGNKEALQLLTSFFSIDNQAQVISATHFTKKRIASLLGEFYSMYLKVDPITHRKELLSEVTQLGRSNYSLLNVCAKKEITERSEMELDVLAHLNELQALHSRLTKGRSEPTKGQSNRTQEVKQTLQHFDIPEPTIDRLIIDSAFENLPEGRSGPSRGSMPLN